MAIMHPGIDPVAVRIGPVAIHWYGIMYLLGFMSAYGLGILQARRTDFWDHDKVADMIFYAALGVVIGGRIGYMLFYNLPVFLADPLTLFKIWQGGMSFHGGLLGVLLALWLFAYRFGQSYFMVTDFVAPLVPLGLAAGRVGNFINGELWGKVTNLPWGVIFPNAGMLPRHPSQLYEALFEGIVLFAILWWYSPRSRGVGAVSGLFLMVYAIFRCLIELVRVPDPQYGYLAFGWLTMGQILSVPMFIVGIILWRYAKQESA